MTSPRSRSLVLTVAATAAAVVLAGCGSDDPEDTASDPAASDSSSPEPTDASEPTSPATSGGGEPGTVAVPIYFVGDGPRGPVLFREFRSVESDNPWEEAVALLLAGDTLDPDYRSPVPGGGQIDRVGFDGIGSDGLLQVVLSDDSLVQRPDGMSKQDAELAVQAVVYTLQGAAQARPEVGFFLDGQPSDFLGIDTSAGLKDAPQLEVLNLVSVTTPEEGATVSGSFTATGVASSFEATVPWEIRQGDEVVKTGFSTAEGWLDKLYPWETEVDVSDLAPGDYTFVALTDDPSGGAEGHGPSSDSKSITVE